MFFLEGFPLVLENFILRTWHFFLRVLHNFLVVGHIWILQPKIKEVFSLTLTSYYRLLEHLPDIVTRDKMRCVECR